VIILCLDVVYAVSKLLYYLTNLSSKHLKVVLGRGSAHCAKQAKKVAILALIASSWPEQYLLPSPAACHGPWAYSPDNIPLLKPRCPQREGSSKY